MEPNPKAPERFDTHEFVPSARLSEIPELAAAVTDLGNQIRAAKLRNSKAKKRTLSDAAIKLLTAAADHPFVRVAELWKWIGGSIGPDTRKTAVAELSSLKLARFDDLRVGKTAYKLIMLQREGWEWLGRKEQTYRGRGGVAHVSCAHWIAQSLATEGFAAAIEWMVPSTSTAHHADVACQLADGSWDVYEIVIDCDSNLLDHLHACLLESTVVSSVVIVASQNKQLAELKTMVEADERVRPLLDRVRYERVTKYIKED